MLAIHSRMPVCMAMPRIGGRTLQFGEQGDLAAHEGLDVALIGGALGGPAFNGGVVADGAALALLHEQTAVREVDEIAGSRRCGDL